MGYKRGSKNINFPKIATITCAGMTLIYLINAIVYLIVTKINGGATDSQFVVNVISYFINVIFYFSLTGQFMRSKDNFGYASNGIRILLICDYVLPFVLNGVVSIVLNPLTAPAYIVALSISFGIAIAYFVLFTVDRRRGGASSGVQTAMIVLGAIMAASALTMCISNVYTYATMIIAGNLNIYSIVTVSFEILTAIFSFLETFLYLLFAIYLKKYTKLGY